MVTDDLLFVAILGTDGVEGISAGTECSASKINVMISIIIIQWNSHMHTDRQTDVPGDGTLLVNSPTLAVTLGNCKLA